MVDLYGRKVESVPSVSIKNPEVYRLIKELADLRGKTMTAVVIEAVREKLERERERHIDHARVEHFLRVGRELRTMAAPEWLARDQTEDLYDDEQTVCVRLEGWWFDASTQHQK